jgi:hypothetical protein
MSLFSFGERQQDAADNKGSERPEFGGFMLPNSNTRKRNILDFIPSKPQKEQKNLNVEATQIQTTSESLEVSDSLHKERSKKPIQEFEKKEKQNSIKSINTVSGNYILSRGWESSNMSVFRSKKRK